MSQQQTEPETPSPARKKLCVGLVVVSFILYGLIFLAAFIPLDTKDKALLLGGLYILSQAAWITALVLGREFVKSMLSKLWTKIRGKA